MPFIIILAAVSFAAAVIFNKKIYETVPVAVFALTLGVYLFALIMPIDTAFYICIAAAALFFVIIMFTAFRKYTGAGKIKEKLISVFVPVIPWAVPVIVCIIFCALLSGRKVFYYDDLSYWALYTKNIFSIGKLPHLFENCSVDYKDYTPIVQILQYLVMFGESSFSETSMFRTNVCLMYVLLLPLLSVFEDGRKKTSVKIAAVILYVIFPHILTSQFYYRLGVDLLLALAFGYVLYNIFFCKTDVFIFIRTALGLSFLALIKTSGIVLCILAIIMMFAIEMSIAQKVAKKTALLVTSAMAVFPVGAYLSWQLFLRYSWNNGYLSNRVKAGVTGGGLQMPPYTAEVVINYIRHFFTYPLTRNMVGVTSALLVVFIITVHVVSRKVGSVEEGYEPKKSRLMFILITVGLFVFCFAHLSMYLLVFDEWEAHGLMEFDRYITQYLGGAFYLYCYVMLMTASAIMDVNDKKTAVKFPAVIMCVFTALFVLLLPYKDMNAYLVRKNYDRMYGNNNGGGYAELEELAKKESVDSGIAKLGLPHDGSARVTMIANCWDEETQFLVYELVPNPIDRILNVPAVEAGKIAEMTDDYLDDYVYVALNAEDSYEGDWSETGEFTENGQPLSGGTLYRVNRLNDVKTLVPVEGINGNFNY